MTNLEIIAGEAIKNQLFTEGQIMELLASGKEIPLHTFAGWKARGKVVRKGEHAKVTTRLWRFKKGADKKEAGEDGEDERNYYLTKAFLFSADQVEAI